MISFIDSLVGSTNMSTNAGYLACARCSNTGALVLVEPVSTVNGGDQPLSPPKAERCPNCAGSGKVRILSKLFLFLLHCWTLSWIELADCLMELI